jgi:ribonuclease Z
MPISFQVLGQPGRDNALYVKVDTGQAQTRLLFDCGDGCPHQLAVSELREIDHLCFSHLHMDHVAGFDLFFRLTFDRTAKPNRIWVPFGSGEVIHHRFRGFMWNLVDDKQRGEWLVSEIGPGWVRSARYLAREAFRIAHAEPERARRDRVIFEGDGFLVEAVLLDHGTPSVGYVVREHARVNVDTDRLAARGLTPGPWLQRVRALSAAPGETVTVNGVEYQLALLQDELLFVTLGSSIAYLTDLRMTPAASDALAEALRGVGTVVCESQYRAADAAMADAAMHSTSAEVARMAAKAQVGQLVLFHISGRYDAAARRELLAEAQAIFAKTTLPEGWD